MGNSHKKIIQVLLTTIFIDCGSSKITFSSPTLSITQTIHDGPEFYNQSIFLIVSNRGYDLESFERNAQEYCRNNVILPTRKKYEVNVIFLKKTNYTPSNYKEIDKFNLIGHHMDDKILTITFFRSGSYYRQSVSRFKSRNLTHESNHQFTEALYQTQFIPPHS